MPMLTLREIFQRWDQERRERAAAMRRSTAKVEAGQRHLLQIIDASEDADELSWGDTRPLSLIR